MACGRILGGFGALSSRNLKATFAVNGSALVYPQACAAARDAGWDLMVTALFSVPCTRSIDQKAAIRDTIAAISDFTGHAPRGWESPV